MRGSSHLQSTAATPGMAGCHHHPNTDPLGHGCWPLAQGCMRLLVSPAATSSWSPWEDKRACHPLQGPTEALSATPVGVGARGDPHEEPAAALGDGRSAGAGVGGGARGQAGLGLHWKGSPTSATLQALPF